jgi:hypothetical protein
MRREKRRFLTSATSLGPQGVVLALVLLHLSPRVLPEQTFPAALHLLGLVLEGLRVNEFALLAGVARVLRREEDPEGPGREALAPVVGIVRGPSAAGVAEGVGAGAARPRLVQSGAAPGADPAGLAPVVGRVGPGSALRAEGVPAPPAPLRHSPARGATAAVGVAPVMAQVRAALADLKVKKKGN